MFELHDALKSLFFNPKFHLKVSSPRRSKCTGWVVSVLGGYPGDRFSPDAAHIHLVRKSNCTVALENVVSEKTWFGTFHLFSHKLVCTATEDGYTQPFGF